MKKLIFIVLLFVSLLNTNAQIENSAIGLRLGYSAEISYIHPLSDVNRLEADLGVINIDGYSGFFVTGIYQWTWDLSQYITDGFGWYAGAGAGIGGFDKSFGIAISGQIGLEYNFNFPLQLTLDYRPGISIIPKVLPIYTGFALSARYRF